MSIRTCPESGESEELRHTTEKGGERGNLQNGMEWRNRVTPHDQAAAARSEEEMSKVGVLQPRLSRVHKSTKHQTTALLFKPPVYVCNVPDSEPPSWRDFACCEYLSFVFSSMFCFGSVVLLLVNNLINISSHISFVTIADGSQGECRPPFSSPIFYFPFKAFQALPWCCCLTLRERHCHWNTCW